MSQKKKKSHREIKSFMKKEKVSQIKRKSHDKKSLKAKEKVSQENKGKKLKIIVINKTIFMALLPYQQFFVSFTNCFDYFKFLK